MKVRRTIVIPLKFLMLLLSSVDKKINLGHNLRTMRGRVFVFHIYSLLQDLSMDTIIVDLVTLTVVMIH